MKKFVLTLLIFTSLAFSQNSSKNAHYDTLRTYLKSFQYFYDTTEYRIPIGQGYISHLQDSSNAKLGKYDSTLYLPRVDSGSGGYLPYWWNQKYLLRTDTGSTVATQYYVSQQYLLRTDTGSTVATQYYVSQHSGSTVTTDTLITPFNNYLPPKYYQFSWVNQGRATIDTTYGALYLSTPASSVDSSRLLVKAISSPDTIVVCFNPQIYSPSSFQAGLCWRDSSTKKFVVFSYYSQSGGGNLAVQRYDSSTHYNSIYGSATPIQLAGDVWMMIVDDGANRKCYWSEDGRYWSLYHTISRTDFMTPNQVGFFVNASNSSYGAAATFKTWDEHYKASQIFAGMSSFALKSATVAYSDTGSKVPSYYKTLGQLSSTYLPYFNGTSLLNTSIMYNGGNVGIGTTSPGSSLAVKGSTSNSSASALNITNSSDVSSLFVRNDGKVGIGTTSPGQKLVIQQAGGNLLFDVNNTSLASTYSGMRVLDNGAERWFFGTDGSNANGDWYMAADAARPTWEMQRSTGKVTFPVGSSSRGYGSGMNVIGNVSIGSGYYATAAPTDGMIIQGNVGIGTTSPAGKLNVISTTEQMRLGYDASNYNSFTVGSTGNLTIAGTGTNPSIILTPGGTGSVQVSNLTASKVVFTDASKNLTSTGIGTSGQFIKGDGSLDGSVYITSAGTATNFSGSLAGDVTGTQGATVVGKINGTSLAGLGTGILKNTTGTGVPSIAIAADFPTLNQNTTGSAATLTTSRNLWGQSFNGSADVTGNLTSVGNITGSSAVTIAAGDSNQNVVLTPSGTGYTLLNGNVGIDLTNPAYALDMAAGDAYGYNGTVMAQASTTLFNYFLGGAGTIGAATTGTKNTGTGYQALSHLTTGSNNTANGLQSLYYNTTGSNNTANGMYSLYSDTTGAQNTANGYKSLYSNTTGSNNTANGMQSLYYNTTGNYNTANGMYSLYSNTTGAQNTANGYKSLYSNTTGSNNTANGMQSLYSNTTGSNNTANGMQSLYSNTTGNYNTANGLQSLYNNTTGSNNTANGMQSLYSNTTGNYNTANGLQSLYNDTTGGYNTANGYESLYNNTTGINNTANGLQSLYNNTTGSNNTANGMYSLYSNTTGAQNTANGYESLYNNTTNIATLGAITGGSGYTPGTYTGVQMTLSSGSSATTYPIATIIASSTGAITSVVITTNGLGFKDTTTFLTAPTSSLGGTGSGFSVAVASLSTGQYNTAYGYQAGRFISGGVGLNETSTYSTYIGYNAYPLASGDINETVIGKGAVGSGSNTVTLGGTGTTGTIIPYGNVGIGSTTTDSTLRVAGSGNFTTNLKVGGRFNLAGAVATVNLDTTEAGGVPAISDTVEYTGLTAAVSQRNFNYTNHAGFYEVDGCLVVTTGVPTGAITVNIVYTDALGATTQTPILAFVATGTGRTYFHIPVRTVSGWVAWSTTLVAAPTYNISLACKRIY